MDEELERQEQIKLEDLLCSIRHLSETQCNECGSTICGHEALMSFAMGFKDAPRCWPCLADTMGHEKEVLRDHLLAYIKLRSCHYAGWQWASREEGFDPEKLPSCLWPDDSSHEDKPSLPDSAFSERHDPGADLTHDMEWDSEGIGCGDLVLELRIRLQRMKPGQILKLIATDSGAQTDLPAWCRLTKHTLLFSQHPVYLIRRKTS